MKTALLVATLALGLLGLQDAKPPKPEPLKVDTPAPTFHLNDNTGKTIAIGGKQESWTVLAFYPKAMTPG